ncbi:MAG: MmgE/PrpD family protein [Thaumarchaeota archaeon]|nr:MmgE/PrpD family protein [Nitrososphaerota archaeon]
MGIADSLSEYVRSTEYGQLDGRTVAEAKRRIADSLGCAFGAFDERPVEVGRQVAEADYKEGASTVLGTSIRRTADIAAFVNGTMIRELDFNDMYLSKEPAHPSDNLAAILAVAEQEGSSGKEILLATTLAYEVQCRLADCANLMDKGWDHVAYGLVSSALGAGKLMGLTAEQLTQAVNIALGSHIALRQVRTGEPSYWRGASFANAAKNAIFSALLARKGMTGPSPIFEGSSGFFKQVSGPFEVDPQSFGGRGGEFRLKDTYLKNYPAEYHSQSAIAAALEVMRKIRDLGDVESVEVRTQKVGFDHLAKHPEMYAPSRKEIADRSFPFIIAMAFIEGRVDTLTYGSGNYLNPKVREFAARIAVKEDDALTAMYPEHIANRVSVKLKGGGSLSEQIDDPLGHPSNPMADGDVEAKFRGLVGTRLSQAQMKTVMDFVWTLEKRDGVSPLMEACEVAGDPSHPAKA